MYWRKCGWTMMAGFHGIDMSPQSIAPFCPWIGTALAMRCLWAALRAQLEATPPGEAGPDYQGCVGLLRGVQEKYPELRAQDSFLNLQRNLTDTEQRIALARSYFNDIATYYNTRLERVPDRFLRGLAGIKPRTLMAAADFERASVSVDLAS